MAPPIKDRTKVFISYSHKDKEWLERIQVHLKPIERDYGIDLWDDTRIGSGGKWKESIDEALSTTKVAILLVSANFLASDFITKYELPRLLEAVSEEGVHILPLILSPSLFQENEDIGRFQAFNDLSRPLISLSRGEQEDIFLGVARRAKELLKQQVSLTLEENQLIYSDIALPEAWVNKNKDADDLEKILGGKGKNPPRVIEIRGLGGSGKSCFTRKFLSETDERGLKYRTKIWFSFYKLRGQIDPFAHFLDFVSERLDSNYEQHRRRSLESKRTRLEEIFRDNNALVILDGLEIAQGEDGILRNPEFTKFLHAALNFQKSHFIITTRAPLSDLEGRKGFLRFSLGTWSFSDVYEFFMSGGIKGGEKEIKRGTEEVINTFGYHPLTLTIFKFLLVKYYDGAIEEASRVIGVIKSKIRESSPSPELPYQKPYQKQLGKLKAIIDDLWVHLNERERLFLKRLSALYGEAYEETYRILTNEDPYAPEFRETVSRFKDHAVIIGGVRGQKPTITAHPMIKQAFYELMDESERKETHKILAAFFQDRPKPESPQQLSDLDDFVEWFQQCIAGNLFKEAFDILEKHKLRFILYFIGWYEPQLELIESLTKKVLEDPKASGIGPGERCVLTMTQGHITRKLGRVKEALGHFEEARHIASGENLVKEEYAANIEEAITYGFIGKFRKALEILPKESLRKKTWYDGPRLEWMGYSKAILGEYEEGVRLLKESEEICRARKDIRHLPPVLTHLGDILLLLGNRETALQKFEEALEVSKREKYKDYEGDAKRGIGDYYLLEGDLQKARAYFQDALKDSEDLGYQFLKTETLIGLSRSAENSEEAKKYANQGLRCAKESGYLVQQADAFLLLTRHSAGDNNKRKKEYLKEAETIITETEHLRLSHELARVKTILKGGS